ncbi:alanyl-tRNA editing protein AlaX [miscellaneous Crenarchaeota group-15 archaeon DG-45]|uniref:Alanyl-tRNA editing protein AlaX n=1 Tax=miscellaneous Crenarchaeota group-15 archaeon DG-45 TaxID=1685127 RepID=A0A0M0BLM7_9ARCH|nr:MAG: alanyl-tRNA editing protein AlaX [miscellaneous Crenarchaeota group-15 archaeon DG-45]
MSSHEVRTHTALHVLKGAVQKVLGAEWTAGVYVKGSQGRLTVQLQEKPTDEELARVEEEANAKIAEDAPIEELEMERAEAEARWGDAIYDLFPLPASITRLRIAHIPGWNVNACREAHTETTGEIGALRITKTRFRPSRQTLEISFDIRT